MAALAKLIEVTGIVINPERHRFDDGVVICEIDCNGPLRETNKPLWDVVERLESARKESARGKVESSSHAPATESNSLPLADGDPFGGSAYGVPEIGGLFAAPRPRKPSSHLTFKGPVEAGELQPQRTYRFYGEVTEYTNKRTGQPETQFSFRSFCKVRGHGQAGTLRYLMDCPHIGKATADKLWLKFEGEAVRILRETPDVAVVAVGLSHFTEMKAIEASEYLKTQQAMESCTIELIDLLGGRGFPKSTAQAVVREWGNRAAELIRRDPYYLMQFRGCGFLKCDKMALSMGMDPARMKRQALAAWYVLASDAEGHTWKSAELVARGISKMIGGVDANPLAALKLAKRAKLIEVKNITDPATGAVTQTWIAEGKRARQERYVCERVASILAEPAAWPDFPSLAEQALSGVTDFRPTDHQLQAVVRATRKSLGVLRGGPGTGKSFTTAVLIKVLELLCGDGQIAVCAPTGKATARLKAALSEYKCGTVPRTIHSLLGVAKGGADPDKRDTGGWSFIHNADNPLPHRFVFLDEGSMPSTDLMASFLAACGPGTNVLIIGDINQLPPIQHGAPLRDMLAAGIPSGELTEPQRNSGTIVMACCDIRDDKAFRTNVDDASHPNGIDVTAKPPRNFAIIEAGTPPAQLKAMCDQLDWAVTQGLDPVWDCQVVVAVNDKSPLSRKIVNKILQEKLNPNGHQIDGNPFRVGDKVICTDNGWYLCEDREAPYADPDGKCLVSNGEFGRVLKVEPKSITVRFDCPDRVICFSKSAPPKDAKQSARERAGGAPSEGDEGDTSDTDQMDGDDKKPNANGCNLELAYGCTCHKLQGSEAKFVLPLLDDYPGARRICRREWFFTALSRGKVVTKPIGKRATADAMCRTAALPERKTFLKEMLLEKIWGDL